MNENEQIITKFYLAFQQSDYQTMQACYHDEAIFFDPIFEDLNAAEVRAMWQMMVKNAKGFSMIFNNVHSDGEYGGCTWIARYTFSQTGRSVKNVVKAYFKFHDGKIIEHTDNFDTWTWSRQALGVPGWILGWSNALQQKIRNKAQGNLAKFMAAPDARLLNV